MPIAAISPARGVFATIAEEKICAARGAESGRRNIFGCDSGACENGAIRGDQIEMRAGRGRRVSRRPHREPGQPVRIVVAIFQRVERACKPFAGVRKLCGEFFHNFVAHFVAAAADAWTERGDYVLRAGAKFHLHAAEGFFRDALRGAAPAGMNRGDGALLGVGEQDGNAVGGLDGQQHAGLASDEGVAFGSFFALRKFGGTY